jgi:hypothetical protein
VRYATGRDGPVAAVSCGRAGGGGPAGHLPTATVAHCPVIGIQSGKWSISKIDPIRYGGQAAGRRAAGPARTRNRPPSLGRAARAATARAGRRVAAAWWRWSAELSAQHTAPARR